MATASIKAHDLILDVPVLTGNHRNLLTSPIQAIREFYGHGRSREFRTILNGISFSVLDGERVALIGANGAGKTTLLRTCSGVLQPTSGSLEVMGTRQALLNLQLGMQQEATGWENIFLCGLAVGLSMDEIRDRAQEIITFSELGNAIHDPIQIYSSGMKLRLAFATLTTVRTDILLMDEWVGAGDISFIEKAKKRLLDKIEASKILVLASHNENILKAICSRGIVLRKGQIAFDSNIQDALDYYKSPAYWVTSAETRTAAC